MDPVYFYTCRFSLESAYFYKIVVYFSLVNYGYTVMLSLEVPYALDFLNWMSKWDHLVSFPSLGWGVMRRGKFLFLSLTPFFLVWLVLKPACGCELISFQEREKHSCLI